MDSAAPPASRSRCGGSEIFGGPPSVGTAGQWSSSARRRSRAGENAHSDNNACLYSTRSSKIAIQNPIEQEGTYQLPEAQLDRFMFKLNIGYPHKREERTILDLMATSAPDLRVDSVIEPKQIIAARNVVNEIYIDDRVKDYIVDVVWATREPASYNLRLEGLIRYGASPRATIYLALGARAHAFLNGRGYVTPQDVKSIGPDVLRHRIIVSYEAEAEAVTSETIIERIFAGLPVP